MSIPGYWMHETGGELQPAVKAYLTGTPINDRQISLIRAYLKQWIDCPMWQGDDVTWLREAIPGLTSREAIHRWADRAAQADIDPF
jgi:hypothetical protein